MQIIEVFLLASYKANKNMHVKASWKYFSDSLYDKRKGARPVGKLLPHGHISQQHSVKKVIQHGDHLARGISHSLYNELQFLENELPCVATNCNTYSQYSGYT